MKPRLYSKITYPFIFLLALSYNIGYNYQALAQHDYSFDPYSASGSINGRRNYNYAEQDGGNIPNSLSRRPPTFQHRSYSKTVPEDTPKDTEIMEVRAISHSDREIKYSLQFRSRGAGTFMIDPATGKIFLAKELDYEDVRHQSYALRVNATEDTGGLHSYTDFTVTVSDVNDNAPRFELPDYQVFNVLEDVKQGTKLTTITAIDLDSGKNGEIDYTLDRAEFTIDSHGNIFTNRRLDADTNNTYVLTVKATDRGSPSKVGTATVRIYTDNTNDEPPKFSQDVYTPNIDENALPGTFVTTVVATDKDGDNVIYGFSPTLKPSIASLFQIDEKTGVIRLSDKPNLKLDRDRYELNVSARDDGKCCEGKGNNQIHTSSALVVVFITDVNDNKPVFEDCHNYNPTIYENMPAGTTVMKVKATDSDKGHNGLVKYIIVQQPTQNGQAPKFVIDENTGEIKSRRVFDRESPNGRFVSLTVKAVDKGNPPLEGVCSFKVEVLDVNDNPPLFDRQDYHENLRQGMPIGSHVMRVSAMDEDVDQNGMITYSLAPRSDIESKNSMDYFSINPDTGWISLKKPLDRDAFQLQAVARDREKPYHNATVMISFNVIDRENSPPVWDQPIYHKRVYENEPVGTKILSIKASSGIENNTNVFYSLIRGNTEQTNKLQTFYLTPRVEDIYTYADIRLNHPLDFETITIYNLTVRVENDGTQQLASECSINIEILDVNDEIPLFVEREQLTVLESMPIGTKVGTVQAIDPDGTSPNNLVNMAIENKDGIEKLFTIDRSSGDIFTNASFDREEKQSYSLIIKAYDGAPSTRPGSESLPNSVTTKIRIGIGDKNDNAPYFEKTHYEALVKEDADINFSVLTVNAHDKDESSKLRYEIVKGNVGGGGGSFDVNKDTGTIFVNGPLDYELRKEYKLVIVASDNLNENFTTVVIKIQDVNDNPPTFDRPVYQVSSIEEQTLTKPLLKYDLTIVVSDSLLENTTTVTIRLEDVNDTPPKFEYSIYNVTLLEETPLAELPKRILQVTATDGDRDRPQNITYFLTDQGTVGNDKNEKNVRFFTINPVTGEIHVERPLDRDLPNGRSQWRFTVYADDEGGTGGLVGYAEVVVKLKDINDNAPFFPNSNYLGNVTERSEPGAQVMTMQAIDHDDPMEGGNAKIKYAIDQNQVDVNGNLIFSIDPDSGVVTTNVGNLDRELNPEYTLKITATDGGGNQNSVYVTVRVKDVNDRPPKFSKENWQVEVDETADGKLPETPILVLQVTDEDLLETNRFSYRVLPDSYGADKFNMVTNSDGTGSLKVAKELDYEDERQKYGFNLTIEVNDGGDFPEIPNKDTTRVTVKLRDVNDNPPEFDRTNMEVSVKEDAPIRTELATFSARDPDKDGTSRVTYSIDRSTDRKKQFKINPSNGTVSIQRPLDREEHPRMTVKIVASDDGLPQRIATTTLTVIIEDINDNPPRFLKDYVAIVNEHLAPGKIVGEFHAADPDDRVAGNGPPFRFRLDPDAPQIVKDLFDVRFNQAGEGSVIISTKKTLDRELQKEYQIPIIIEDNGRPSLQATNNLTVIIGDINDNRMHPGDKRIFVYNYKGQYNNIPIGRVHVEDQDDWDLHDKIFTFENNISPLNFVVDESGTIYMKKVLEGTYPLRFTVRDSVHTQQVGANVTVIVKNLSDEAVQKSGSIRISGMTDEDFIRVWNWRTQEQTLSKYDRFKELLSRILKESTEDIDIFSVMTHYKKGRVPETDIRFSAHGSQFHKPIFLNGFVAINRRLIEKELGLNITMVGIDECLNELFPCDGSCSNTLSIESGPYVVNANRTALVGVHARVRPICECHAKSYDRINTCNSNPSFCLNGGKCMMVDKLATCECLPGFYGPQCQVTSRTFGGKGWAWFPPLEQCDDAHLSLEFMTQQQNGLIFYNGPLDAHQEGVAIYEDMISLELSYGKPKLIVDFGSGTTLLELKNSKELNDGEWHRLDIFWNREEIRMVVDHCQDAKMNETSERIEMNRASCEQKASMKPYSEFLNLNTPLQMGGISHPSLFDFWRGWIHNHTSNGFLGCIRNFVFNSKTYDLGSPGASVDSESGCTVSDDRCPSNSLYGYCDHGRCSGNFKSASCLCDPGWSGPRCDVPTPSKMIQTNGFLRYALSFNPNPFITDIQMRFRTRREDGELIRIVGMNTHEYCILEIKDKNLRLRYNLNHLSTSKEINLYLLRYNVADGRWHSVRAIRHGSTATLEVDGGGGSKFNETTDFGDYHQLFSVNKQSIVVGGDVNHMGPSAYYVENNLHDSCVSDIRIDQKYLPLENGSEHAAVTESKLLADGCEAPPVCLRNQHRCASPFICVDLWNHHECHCPVGLAPTSDKSGCIDDNECLNNPCFNGGTCINQEDGLGFRCECPLEYSSGEMCQGMTQEKRITMASNAYWIIMLVLFNVIILNAAIYFMIRKKQMVPIYGPNDPDDDVRENIISYEDEGGGEDDMHAFDITPLRIPIDPTGTLILNRGKQTLSAKSGILKDGGLYGITSPYESGLPGQIIDAPAAGLQLVDPSLHDDHEANAANASRAALDDLKNYAYEGCGSTAGSLSSLASLAANTALGDNLNAARGNDVRGSTVEHDGQEPQDFNYLNCWGPRFQNLAYLYGGKDN